MSLPLHLLLDDEGRPRARWTVTGPAAVVLPEFLETDLGFDRYYAMRLVDEGHRVRSGDAPAWTGTGNAFGVSLGPDQTTVEPLVPGPRTGPVTVDTRDFLELIERWLGLIGGDEEA